MPISRFHFNGKFPTKFRGPWFAPLQALFNKIGPKMRNPGGDSFFLSLPHFSLEVLSLHWSCGLCGTHFTLLNVVFEKSNFILKLITDGSGIHWWKILVKVKSYTFFSEITNINHDCNKFGIINSLKAQCETSLLYFKIPTSIIRSN